MADDISVKFGADVSAFNSSLKEAKSSLSEVTTEAHKTAHAANGITKLGEALRGLVEPLRGVRENLGGLAEAFAAAFAVHEIAEWVDRQAELGEQMVRSGAEMGVTASQASELSGVAKLTGTEFETFRTSIERFNLNLARAGTESSVVAQGLQALGLSAKQFVGIPIDQQIEKLAEATSHFADGGNKTAAIMAILGRSGAEMLPFLDRGKEGMQELQEVMQRTGAVMSNDMAAGFEQTKEHISEMSLAWQGLSNRIFSVVRPALDALIQGLTSVIEHLKADDIREAALTITDDIGVVVKVLADFALQVQDVFSAAGQSIDDLAKKAALIAGATAGGALIGGPLGAAAGLIGGLAGAHLAGGADPVDDLDARVKKTNADIDSAVSSLKGLLSATGSGPYGDLSGVSFPGGGKPQAGAMDTSRGGSSDDALQAALKGYNDQIQAAQKAYQDEVKIDALKVSGHQMTELQKLADTKTALDQEFQAESAALNNELKLEDLKPAKRKEINDKLLALDKQYAAQSQQLAQQTTNAQLQAFQKITGPITSGFNAQLNGLLTGTESISQAFQKMAVSVVESFVQMIAKALEMKIAMSLLQIPGFGSAVGSITSLLPGFARGADDVPNDMVAQIHKGEMIIPSSIAGPLRTNMSSVTAAGNSYRSNQSSHAFHYAPQISAPANKSIGKLLEEGGDEARSWFRAQMRNGSLK